MFKFGLIDNEFRVVQTVSYETLSCDRLRVKVLTQVLTKLSTLMISVSLDIYLQQGQKTLEF